MGRVVAVVAALMGLTLIGFALFEHLPARAGDAQKVADHYRPLMSTQGLTDLRTGFSSLKAAGAELDASALPRLRQRMGMTQAQFDAYVSTSMPGIKAFNDQAPGVVALV